MLSCTAQEENKDVFIWSKELVWRVTFAVGF